MDLPLGGDLTDRIILDIISDDTNDAEIVINDDGSIFTKSGNDYTAQVKSGKEGEVKLRAKICDRTIQAITFAGTDIASLVAPETEVDCIEDVATEDEDASPSLGALTKVDRIISIFFVRVGTVNLGQGDDGSVASSTPQAFGTSLEN